MSDPSRRRALLLVALFGVALAMRALFACATPDAAGPFSPLYKGDAPLWLAYAAAVDAGRPFELELGLPLRPPGTAWLIAAVWDGTADGLGAVRWTWLVLGALLAPLTALAAWRLGPVVATVAGAVVATSSGALVLAASPNSEIPYAVLAVASVGLAGRLAAQPTWTAVVGFGLLQGAACLFRAEHLLLALGLGAWLAVGARRRGSLAPRARIARAAAAIAAAAVVLLPWQFDAAAAVARYNREVRRPVPAPTLRWSEAAAAELARLPGFARADTQRFVEATVRHRGGRSVEEADLAILDEAFGCRPRPLPGLFFVALYGPLNFRLANGPDADGGFSRAALDARPPLAGGEGAYPPDWLASLPDGGSLALDYPPHLAMVLDGYGLGLAWIAAHPVDFAGLALRKLWRTWAGAAHGFGGHALPLGAGGVRRRVDLTVPTGPLSEVWRALLLAVAAVGVVRGARRAEAWPWLLWLLAVVVVSAAFFGYARQGAAAVPAVAVCVALGVEPWFRRRAVRRVGVAAVALLVVVELVRYLAPPTIVVDGAPAGRVEPWPPLGHEDRRVELR